MTGTSAAILEFLREHPTATAVEVSAALGMTRANIRYHLDRLMKLGQVEVVPPQSPGGRGRPAKLFRITQDAQRPNLEGLVGALLAEVFDPLSPDEQGPVIRRIARQVAAPPEPLAANLTRRVAEAVRRLNELSYQARWEAYREGPRVYLVRCPYAGLPGGHHEVLCQLDACLIETLVGYPAVRKSPIGLFPCIYQVQVD